MEMKLTFINNTVLCCNFGQKLETRTIRNHTLLPQVPCDTVSQGEKKLLIYFL